MIGFIFQNRGDHWPIFSMTINTIYEFKYIMDASWEQDE